MKGRAFVVDKDGEGFRTSIRELSAEQLPRGDTLIQVLHSSVNYKDALACVPDGKVVRSYPFVPGIDLAGVVISSDNGSLQAGDQVLVTGYELGVSHYGGYSQYARVPSHWVHRVPEGLTLEETMALGTAGITAALSVLRLQDNGVRPGDGPIVVTGASGGVGSMAVAILARLGYEVVASTGKLDMHEQLLHYGAVRVIGRDELCDDAARPLNKQRWAGAVDCVGGSTLASVISAMNYGGTVAASGLTGGTELRATVLPFILRGVRLIGIDSVYMSRDTRERIWSKLAADYKPALLARMYRKIGLEGIPGAVDTILKGESRGRFVVDLQ